MKNFYGLILFFIFFNGITKAQITGSAVVCPAFIYQYSVIVPGATTYNWTLPSGWIIMSGQGTSQVTAFCNANSDSICVDALDNTGNLLFHSCKTLSWGGGNGWDASLTAVLPCLCDPVAISVTPNNTTCPGTCGSGMASPNTFFAAYDNVWPTGNYLGPADGQATYPRGPIGNSYTVYVYQVDTTWGLNNAVLITGGACPTVVNNVLLILGCSPIVLTATVSPDTVCVGDTFTVTSTTFGAPAGFFWFTNDPNVTFLGTTNYHVVQGVLTGYNSSPIQLTITETDINGCYYIGHGYVISANCNSVPTSGFTTNDTTICTPSCISFSNHTLNATSYHWLFPGANPASDSSSNPHNICYTTPGNYNVTLIASNQNGSDTLTLNNYITVHPVNNLVISQSGDTLHAGTSYASYQWFEDSVLIPAANNNYFVPQHNGNYGVLVVDSNGCEATSLMLGVMVSINERDQNNVKFAAYYNGGNLILDFTGVAPAFANIEIISASGKVVYSKKDLNIKTGNRFTLPLYSSPGIYVIRLRMNDSVLVNKFVVQ